MADLCNIINKITGCDATKEDEGPQHITVPINAKGRVSRIQISLKNALNDQEFHLSGDFIAIASITGDATCMVKLDYRHAEAINFRDLKEIKTHFERLFVTTDAYGALGTCTLYICNKLETTVVTDFETVISGYTISITRNALDYPRSMTLVTSPYKSAHSIFRNSHTTRDVYIGTYNPNDPPSLAEFRGWSLLLPASEIVTMQEVNLSEVGCSTVVNGEYVSIQVLGSLY